MVAYEYRCSRCGSDVIAENSIKWPFFPPRKGKSWKCKVYRTYDCPKCGHIKERVLD